MNVEKELKNIVERNKKVESDKAWEISKTRKVLLILMTYIVIVIFLFLINISNPWITALIPTLGYALSTLSLPMFKKLWVNSVYKK